MESLQRSELLYGAEGMSRLAGAKVIIFGVGGVGSWCAEALARSGVGMLTMVDADVVDVSNINRQLPATVLTVGQPKAEALARRLLEIRPGMRVEAVQAFYSPENKDIFRLEEYDFVVDAIDSVGSKACLLRHAASIPGLGIVSSMGAARKVDPGMVAVAEFWKVKGCPLARALRDKFKREGLMPRRKIQCVYSPEAPKGEPKGTSMAVTATFGLRLASLVVNKIAGI